MSIWYEQMGGVSLADDGVFIADGNKITKIDFVGASISYNVATKVAQVSISSVTSLPPVGEGNLIGRYGTGTGTAQEVNVSGGLEITTGGDLQIADDGVTFAKMQNIGVGLIGNDTGTNSPKLVPLGAGLAFVAGALAVAAFTIGSLSPIANNRVLGNVSGVSAAPSELSGTQVLSMLPVFGPSGGSHAVGIVPDPGASAGTTRFLCEDGTWKVTSGSFAGPANPADDNKLAYAIAGNFAYASAIKTDGTFLAFGSTTAASGLERFPHNPGVALMAAIGSDGTTTYPLFTWGAGSNNKLTIGDATVPLIESKSYQSKITLSAQSASALAGFTITGGSHTTLTAGTEVSDIVFDLGQTKQWATGSLTTQRGFRVIAPTGYAFVGASALTTQATMAISGAPGVGTNAAVSQSLALWIESGGIGYGTGAALTGLNRIAHNSIFLAGRSSTSTDINLVRWGVTTDRLDLGDDGAASVYASSATTFGVRVGAATRFTVSTTQVDFNGLNVLNINAINGVRVTLGVLGTALADSNATLSVAGGSIYQQTTAFTSNHVIILSETGAGDDEVVEISRHVVDGFTLTVNDSLGNLLYLFPAGQKRLCTFRKPTGVSAKFTRGNHMAIS